MITFLPLVMRLKQLHSQSDPEFQETWLIYESSFPPDERQSKGAQKKRFGVRGYSWSAAVEGGQVIGMLEFWNFSGFSFVDHIAIADSHRNRG